VRISDARYTRDLRRYQLAWRFIVLGARTRTAQRWSGLSMYRVRTLYEAYAGGAESAPRGVAPHQVSFFWRSAQLRSEAAVLAGFLMVYGVLPPETGPKAAAALESVERGERLCRAYEEFRACWAESQSTLEHAILLAGELVRDVEVGLARCTDCGVLILADRLSVSSPRCAVCRHERQVGRPYAVVAETTAKVLSNSDDIRAGTQGRLF
jgi:Flagellar transcriptional activator (FlhC)